MSCCYLSHRLPASLPQVNKRGKVSSRPSDAQRLKELQERQKEFEAEAAAAAKSSRGAAEGGEAARPSSNAASSSSSSSSAGSSFPSGYTPTSSPSSSSGSSGRGRGEVQYGSDAAVPEQVTNRMLKRIIIFCGAPVFTGARAPLGLP